MTKLVVIEDEDQIREEVMDWLRFDGYEVVGASNGRLGLAVIDNTEPDLILCDIAMPELNGHEVLIEVRSSPKFSHIPFIFTTAAADRDSIRKGMDLGADDYLTKPFNYMELVNAVHSRLEKKALADKLAQNQIDLLNNALQKETETHLLKTRLVAMFSHDFRNPLSVILSSSGILRQYENRLSPERKQQQLDRIDGSIHQLLLMIDDMLMIAEVENGSLKFEPQAMDLSNFVATVVDEFQLIDHSQHTITFHNTIQKPVEGDPKLLRQILSNLLSNAIKYSPQGTEVTLSLSESNGILELAVEDQGIGVPENSLPHLFEPFHRADNVKTVKGTGLGLSIVKSCVECHGGKIDVKSHMGKGTRFTINIPTKYI